MKTPKLIQKIKALLSGEDNELARQEKVEALESVLRKLKKKRATLKEEYKQEKDEDRRKKLHKNLKVLRAQKKKAASELDKLRQED